MAGTKIEQALRSAADHIEPDSATAYREPTSGLRREAGSAIDELTRKKIEIVRFESKSEVYQFRPSAKPPQKESCAYSVSIRWRLINLKTQPS